jgi:hypothetical protein
MGNRPYITAAQVRRSVLRRRALEAQLAAEAERSRRTKPAESEPEQVSTSTTSQEA